MGVSTDKIGHLNFHIHMPHLHLHHHHSGGGGGGGGGGWGRRNIPKGCLAVTVGQEEELRRFIIPVMYVNHPLFMELLKEAEEEFGFKYPKGPIRIPCQVEEFCEIRGLIDRETTSDHDENHQNNNLHHHQFLCFKA